MKALGVRIAAAAVASGVAGGGVGAGRGPDPCEAACPCDWNHDGRLDSQDFFDFLSCFFRGVPVRERR